MGYYDGMKTTQGRPAATGNEEGRMVTRENLIAWTVELVVTTLLMARRTGKDVSFSLDTWRDARDGRVYPLLSKHYTHAGESRTEPTQVFCDAADAVAVITETSRLGWPVSNNFRD